MWLITAHNGIKSKNLPRVNIEDYPAVKNHLDKYYGALVKRTDKGDTPYNLRDCVYMDDFSKQKIVYREISENMDACLIDDEIYVNNKCYIITGENLKFLICYLNSKLFNKIILRSANATGGKGVDFINKIKVPLMIDYKKFDSYYSNLSINQAIENIIEQEIAAKFNLTKVEIEYIKNL